MALEDPAQSGQKGRSPEVGAEWTWDEMPTAQTLLGADGQGLPLSPSPLYCLPTSRALPDTPPDRPSSRPVTVGPQRPALCAACVCSQSQVPAWLGTVMVKPCGVR